MVSLRPAENADLLDQRWLSSWFRYEMKHMDVTGWLRYLVHTRLGHFLAGWMFGTMSFAIPIKRLRETKALLAFHHPRPSYPLHILLVPKKAVRSLSELTKTDAVFMVDLFEAVKSLVEEYGLEETGYRLIANGGKYQEFPQLHFHLIAERISDEHR